MQIKKYNNKLLLIKKKFISVIISLLSATCFCQDSQHLIKVNAVPIFNSVYEIQYEYVFDEANSLQIGVGYGNRKNNSTEDLQEFHLENFGSNLNGPKDTELAEKTFTINLDYRFYVGEQDAPRGLYFSPSLQYINYKESYYALERETFANGGDDFDYNERSGEESFNGVNIRALAGLQLLIAQKIVFNPYFGAGFLMGNSKEYVFKNDDDVKGVVLVFGVNVGYAF